PRDRTRPTCWRRDSTRSSRSSARRLPKSWWRPRTTSLPSSAPRSPTSSSTCWCCCGCASCRCRRSGRSSKNASARHPAGPGSARPPTLAPDTIRFRQTPLALLGTLTLAACDAPTSVGDNTRVMVAAPDSAWAEIQPAVLAALEPRSFTVRDERIFDVAHVDPSSEDWRDFRKLRRMLVIGEAADPWIATALDKVEGAVPRAPAILQAQNVWARPQQVTILLL